LPARLADVVLDAEPSPLGDLAPDAAGKVETAADGVGRVRRAAGK